jgi:hypothetical protein
MFPSRWFPAAYGTVWNSPQEMVHITEEADEIIIVDASRLHLDDE